ncbi:MAG: non-homologous end-joining DNA ligase, partial [Actinomycetota bacterium]
TDFFIKQHQARRLHVDRRLERSNGDTPVLVSGAVPRNLPTKKKEPHLAVHTEDHPIEYRDFSGTIPAGNYGAGEMRIFDSGTYEVLEQGPGKLSFRLQGKRFQGSWHLNRTRQEDGKDEWIVILGRDERPAPAPPPPFEVMNATLSTEAFDKDGWIFEPKWDGVRALAVCKEETKLISRNQRDITSAYPELGGLHERLVALDAVVDGEIVAFDEGRPSFEKLQSRINLQNPRDIERVMSSIPVTYIAFDLLYLDGRSLITAPIEERKAALDEIVIPGGRMQVSTFVATEGIALLEAVKQRRLEGLVAKKLGGSYRPGKRVRDWLKIKIVHDADVIIGGWSRGEGSRSTRFGSLLVGAYLEGELRFLGAVGTGFTGRELDTLWPKLQALETSDRPFVEDPTGTRSNPFGKVLRDPHWTKPELVAKVEFRELTSVGRLRAPSYKGLRNDKSAEECLYEDLVAVAHGSV